jgi:Flp pilus assembly protein TadB
MKTGMFAWLICSGLCVTSLAYGQLALSAYFLVLSCLLPSYVAKELRQRRRRRL